jgi:xylulokinase
MAMTTAGRPAGGPLYIGLDSSTQSLTAIVIEVGRDPRRPGIVLETSIAYDEALPHYGTRHGVLPSDDPAVAMSPPVMWAEALDLLFAQLATRLDLRQIAAISGSAQQHGSVYLAAGDDAALEFDPSQPIAGQIEPLLSRVMSPIWMDSSTRPQCAEIAAAVGGTAALAQRTGSRAFERFTGPQIRKFAVEQPQAYARTARIHLVSSFLASLLTGQHAPVDPGDGSGMNLLDLATGEWWSAAAAATAPGLIDKLPRVAPASSVAGTLSRYWRARYGLPAARVITWSGDNPCSLIGVGLVREGRVAISLGTSDTIFGLMTKPRVDPGGTGHVFGAPTGEYMGLTCFANGALARERVRDRYGMTWADFSRALASTPAGNGGRMMLPWFAPEITPPVLTPRVHRFDLAEDDGPANVRAVIEAQAIAMAIHSRWMGVPIDTIHATGGASANPQILQVIADVFGADVYRLTTTNSAALGAALRAWHGDAAAEGHPISWDEVTADLATPDPATRIPPNAANHELYRRLIPIYEHREREATSLPS